MFWITSTGLLIPFLGTSLGAICVLFLKRNFSKELKISLEGFAAGVMTAASVWSLIIPAIEMSDAFNRFAFVPATVGVCFGVVFLLLIDYILPKLQKDKMSGKFSSTAMLVFAVVLHNIPEGMAVGVAFAGLLTGKAGVSVSSAMMLSIGIAIQNFPEGAIISMPLAADGMKKGRACKYGILSGVVEPIAGLLTILLSRVVVPILPYLLGFAAGAMIYVVVEELIPEAAKSKKANVGTIFFTVGFLIMMSLDVALG